MIVILMWIPLYYSKIKNIKKLLLCYYSSIYPIYIYLSYSHSYNQPHINFILLKILNF